MRRTKLLLLSLSLFGFGCGGDDHGNGPTDDAFPIDTAPADAAIDAPPAPPMITISGNAAERRLTGTVPVSGATIEAFANANEGAALAMTTTDAAGNFSLTINTGGLALDGFLKATKRDPDPMKDLRETYLYPNNFVASDFSGVPIQMLTQANFEALSTIAQGNQLPGNGLVALQVIDGSPPTGMPVDGATVTSAPSASVVRYDVNGIPSSQATVTSTDGVAYLFNLPPDVSIFVGATKAGSTFVSHGLKARSDQLTTTLLAP